MSSENQGNQVLHVLYNYNLPPLYLLSNWYLRPWHGLKWPSLSWDGRPDKPIHTQLILQAEEAKKKTLKPHAAGLRDRMNHPTSHHSQKRGVSFPPLVFSFPPTLPSYLMPILLLVKPAFPRSWFNSLTWQETNAATKRLSRFPLVFGAPNGRRKAWGASAWFPRRAVGEPVPTVGTKEPSGLILLMKPQTECKNTFLERDTADFRKCADCANAFSF